MEIAACAGGSFSAVLLSSVTGFPARHVEEQLKAMCRLGLLIETREGYEFFHNRIHQKAYEQIAPDRREAIHYRIAEVLLREQEQAETEEKWLSVGGHLLRCARLIKDAGDGSGLTVPLYRAGMTAKQSAAVEYALQLFRLAEELLDVTAWQEEDDHTLRVKLELAECLFICGRYDEAENCFLEMLAHVAEERDLAAVKKRYKLLHSYAGNAKRVIDLGLQALNHLGFHLVPRRFKFQLAKEILHGWYLFRNSRLEALQHAPFLGDERLAGILEILQGLYHPRGLGVLLSPRRPGDVEGAKAGFPFADGPNLPPFQAKASGVGRTEPGQP